MTDDLRETATVESIACTWCGDALAVDEIDDPRKDDGGGVMCDECYEEHFQGTCDRCYNIVDNTELEGRPGELFAIWFDDDLGYEPGYYRVVRWPLYVQPIIGGAWFFDGALERVCDLDESGEKASMAADAPCSFLCKECSDEIESALHAPGGGDR